MVAAEARVEMPLLKRGALEAWHTAAIRAAAERMSQAPLFIDETPSPSIDHIVARCRQQGKDTGLLLIVVDHLHLISLPEGTGAWSRRIAEVCLRLKAIARELGVPSLCLSELNRGPENRSDRRPMMWDLKNADANAPVGNGNAAALTGTAVARSCASVSGPVTVCEAGKFPTVTSNATGAVIGIGLAVETSTAVPITPTPIFTRWCSTPAMFSTAMSAPSPGVYPTLLDI